MIKNQFGLFFVENHNSVYYSIEQWVHVVNGRVFARSNKYTY